MCSEGLAARRATRYSSTASTRRSLMPTAFPIPFPAARTARRTEHAFPGYGRRALAAPPRKPSALPPAPAGKPCPVTVFPGRSGGDAPGAGPRNAPCGWLPAPSPAAPPCTPACCIPRSRCGPAPHRGPPTGTAFPGPPDGRPDPAPHAHHLRPYTHGFRTVPHLFGRGQGESGEESPHTAMAHHAGGGRPRPTRSSAVVRSGECGDRGRGRGSSIRVTATAGDHRVPDAEPGRPPSGADGWKELQGYVTPIRYGESQRHTNDA